MKRINFKISVIALAIGMFALTSCGGGNSKKQGGTDLEKAAEEIVKDVVKKAEVKETVTANWPDNEYTKQLSKPEIVIKIAGIAEMGGKKMFSLTFADGTKKEQIKACVEKVKADGFTKNASESDGGDTYYMFSASNNAGYDVLVSWAPTAAGLMVSKQ